MARTNVMTGAASGIGRATREVIFVDGGSDVVIRGESTW